MGKGITPFIRKKNEKKSEEKKMKIPILNIRRQIGIIRKPFFEERFEKI